MHQHFEDKPGRLFIFTGAGISAESGLATFRGEGGVWTKYDLNEVCNFDIFLKYAKDDEKRRYIFQFYEELRQEVKKSQPNRAHYACAELQQKYGIDRVKIITTNVDDLHERAGAKEVVHLHGKIGEMLCLACKNVWSIDIIENCRCKDISCNSKVTKPNVVFFGEQAPEYERLNYYMHPKRVQSNDILLVIGSSLEVVGLDMLFRFDRYHPRRTENILLNKDPSEYDKYFKYHFLGSATEKIDLVKSMIEQNFS